MNQNIVLTEKSFARHTKRLQKELATISHNLKLSEAQNMMARIFGMKNYHELKSVLNLDDKNNTGNDFFIKDKIIPRRYSHLSKEYTKNNYFMLEYYLVNEEEVIKNKIPDDFLKLLDLVINSDINDVKEYIKNHHSVINFQIETRKFQPKNILEFSLSFKKYDVLKYLIQIDGINLEEAEYYLITVASQRADFKLFEYLCSVLPYTQKTLDFALLYASSRNLKILHYLLKDKSLRFNANIHFNNDDCLKYAIINANLDIVKFLLNSDEIEDKPSLYAEDWRKNGTDIRDQIIQKLKLHTGEIKNTSGEAIDIPQSEKDDFMNVLNYLIKDYGSKKFVHWLYIKQELRKYINKSLIDVDYILTIV